MVVEDEGQFEVTAEADGLDQAACAVGHFEILGKHFLELEGVGE